MEVENLPEDRTQAAAVIVSRTEENTPAAAVIGGGPAGLMAAEVLSQGNIQVDLYEAKPSIGRKLLIAGKGGLNLTHSEPFESFLSRYGPRQPWLEPFLSGFGPEEVRSWANSLGVSTFVGSSGKVFPDEMNAASLLHQWKKRLGESGVIFHPHHRWLGFGEDGALYFDSPQGEMAIRRTAAVLALGGGSWPQTGSDAAWVPILAEKGVEIAPLRPANCGFDVGWSEHFRDRYGGVPVKPVRIQFTNAVGQTYERLGEFIVTETGVEGSLIYALSAPLRDEIEGVGSAVIHLDLAPDWTMARLLEKLSSPRGSRTLGSHLARKTGLRGVKAGLLWEFVSKKDQAEPEKLAAAIKVLPVSLIAPRPLEEAISTAGGVAFEALDEYLMIKALPGVFSAGEMLDWEAPTGGYLLTACLATGRAAGLGARRWLLSEN